MGRKKEEVEPSRLEQLFKLREERDKGTAFTDDEFQAQYPSLFYFLNEIHVGDKVTERAYLRLQNDGGDVQLSLVQPGAGVACEVLAASVQDAFRRLEERLAGGNGAWRFWSKHKPVLRGNGKSSEKE